DKAPNLLRDVTATPVMTAFPVYVAGRLPHYAFRGLLSVHSRCNLHTYQATFHGPLHRRLQPLRYLHDCPDCYRLERQLPGGIHTR
ncbi:hypothetical protein, partial [Acidithiobacillus ferridurans]|uniref:hypothetical protein n=1 Tax=Acidithiobacillus ferridurans TaxID=1232575 RepID=UPI001C067323